MASIKATKEGIAQIKQAIAKKGWKVYDDRWLLAASQLLEPTTDWQKDGPYAYGCSAQTWERFIRGIAIRDHSFMTFCKVLGLDSNDLTQVSNQPNYQPKHDWGEAPDVSTFYGRNAELETLERLICQDGCQLITITGLAGVGKTHLVSGGIGKTDLSLQLTRRIRGEFDYLIWRRLLNAPLPEAILTDILEFVSDNKATNFPETTEGLANQLLNWLQKHRCLIVLDNVESILQGDEESGSYRAGYEGYGDLFQLVGKARHRSCLLLTSRVKPIDIKEMEGTQSVRSLALGGVDKETAESIFQSIATTYQQQFKDTSTQQWTQISSFYNGNPLALEVAARHILRRFDGSIKQFLAQELKVFGRIRDLLDWHFERLSEHEQALMYWLAINREPVSIAELREDVISAKARRLVPETLDTLEQQIPLEKVSDHVTLQPVLIEYTTECLIDRLCAELSTRQLKLMHSHALIKASAKQYIKESQVRSILKELIERLAFILENEEGIDLSSKLSALINDLQKSPHKHSGYAAGNLLNLLRYSGIPLQGYDFSCQTIRQADLQGVALRDVNFSHCDFIKTSFTQQFGSVYAIALSPDQTLLAMGDSSGNVRLFHLADNRQILCLKGHYENTWITSVAFSPDGKTLASCGMDYSVKLWDIFTGDCLRTLTGHEKWLWTVVFSPDGGTLASGGDDQTIRLWDTSTGHCKRIIRSNSMILSLAFHPQQDILASGSHDGTIKLWSIQSGKVQKSLVDHQNSVWGVAFHPTEQWLASGSLDQTIKLWDISSGSCVNTMHSHTNGVRSVAFSADGKTIASGSLDRTIRLWETQTGSLRKILHGHENGINVVSAGLQDNILASGGSDQVFKLWDMDAATCIRSWRGYADWIWCLTVSPDGRTLASGGLDRTIRLWNIDTGANIGELSGHRDWIHSLAFSPDGRSLASSSDDRTIKRWNMHQQHCQKSFLNPDKEGIWSISFSKNGDKLASGAKDGIIRLWDANTGATLWQQQAHNNWIWSVNFSPDGTMLASCSADQTIRLWDADTGDRLTIMGNGLSRVMSIAFSPCGQQLASGEEYGSLKLWNIRSGQPIRSLQGHTDSIFSIAFSADGRFIASASADKTVRLWNAATGDNTQVFLGHKNWVIATAFTPDSKTLASGSTDGTIRLWNLQTGQCQRILRPILPYAETNITNAKGLSIAQQESLAALGTTQKSN